MDFESLLTTVSKLLVLFRTPCKAATQGVLFLVLFRTPSASSSQNPLTGSDFTCSACEPSNTGLL